MGNMSRSARFYRPPVSEGLVCKLCGGSYDEDEPADETLKGYCSEECEHKDRKIDEAEQRREERQ